MIKVSDTSSSTPIYPDLTPLLDIIFIVMVFLMLTASVRLESLNVELPATDSNAVSEVANQSLTVNILADSPYWALNTKQYIDWDNFKIALLEESKSSAQPIIIAADKTADVQHLVKLLAFMQDNGIPATQLLTEDSTK
ncbi:biopolymer transporter ExbD [Vibrio sp. ZSDZ65]|uniref:Biopolymer transporter ExbD n=1 Tax=Vibrio qingdaonensis TaxID=2829491 RepID=A0A9X3CM10_9VIBR|nr:biopolymer transporter ExbD [Vibrio qingdaonensis]MCW8345760.1 biopolymer transporter ExbD [Vibrio qingdaonensis]